MIKFSHAIAAATTLLLAACASTPAPQPAATPAPAAPAGANDHRTLTGMTAGELIEHFGRPRLQITEGVGTKLQFAGPACILDAYLYPPGNGGGTARVTEIEARNSQGADVNTQACVYAIEQRKGR